MNKTILSKLGILIALTLTGTSSFASCVNLAGNYTLDDPKAVVLVTIAQDQCKTIGFTFSNLTSNSTLGKVYTMDNITTLTNETDELKVFESSSIDDHELLAKVEFFYKAKNKSTTAISHFVLDANTDLRGEYDYYDYVGKPYHQQLIHFIRKP
jgi:hypothetical protein